MDKLLDLNSGVDVEVIQSDRKKNETVQSRRPRSSMDWLGHAIATSTTATAAMLSYLLGLVHIASVEANRVMLFLAGVAFVAFLRGTGPAITASVLSVLAFDFFFVPPFFTFAVADAQYAVTFAVMLAIGLLVSTLASRLRVQIDNSRQRERRSNSLYELGKELGSLYGEVFLVSSAVRTLGELVDARIVIFLKKQSLAAYPVNDSHSDLATHPVSVRTAEWVIKHAQVAGLETHTFPNACALFVPLHGTQSCFGAMAVQPRGQDGRLHQPDIRRLLESGANQLALALERDRLTIEAAESRLHAEAEQLRSTLLSSVSHDLKTPLAAIEGASSSLLESNTIDQTTRRELLETIVSQAKRLNRVLEKILQMSRLDAGASCPNLEWHVLEEIVGSAMKQTASAFNDHTLSVVLPADLPLIYVDDIMLEQVLINLLENAVKYTPIGTSITIAASLDKATLRIWVRDQGDGIPLGLEDKIFDKFYRANDTPDAGAGNGLGLAICRAIIRLLGGTITASSPSDGGAQFMIQLPQSIQAPSVNIDS